MNFKSDVCSFLIIYFCRVVWCNFVIRRSYVFEIPMLFFYKHFLLGKKYEFLSLSFDNFQYRKVTINPYFVNCFSCPKSKVCFSKENITDEKPEISSHSNQQAAKRRGFQKVWYIRNRLRKDKTKILFFATKKEISKI